MERKRQPVSSVRKHRVSLGKRRDSRSHLAVPNDPDANPCGLSSADFLATMERSGILSETGLQEVRDCLVQDRQLQDSSVLAERLVKQGRLTEFQARRLLVGKAKSLVFGRYVLLDRLGIGAMGRVFKARHRLMDRLVALKVVLPVCASSKHSASRFSTTPTSSAPSTPTSTRTPRTLSWSTWRERISRRSCGAGGCCPRKRSSTA